MIKIIFEDITNKLTNLNKKIKDNFNKGLEAERENLRNMYIKNVSRNLKVKKSTWLSNVVRTKMYRNNVNKPNQLNIYAKSSHLIYSHFDKLTSQAKKGHLLIKLDYVKLTRREFNNLIKISTANRKMFVDKTTNIVYIKLDKTNRKFLRKIIKQNYLNLDKKEQSKIIRQTLKKHKEEDIPVPVAISVKNKVTRRNRLKLDVLKRQMESYLINKIKLI